MTDFTTRLNQAMELRNIKQIDFVKAAQDHGVKLGRSHISQYVSGKTRPRRDIERFLAAVLRVNADWLAGESVPFDDDPETFAKIEHVSPDADFEHIKRVEQNSSIQNSEHIEHNNELAEIEQEQDMEAAANNNVQDPSFPDVPSSVTSEPMNIGSRRVFTKSHKLDNVLYDVRGPVVNEAARMEAAGMHVMKLNIGNPAPFGFRTPDEVVYDMAQQLTDTEGYSASKGLFSARKAIMQYAQLKNLPNVGVEDIYTGNGVSELINLSMSALLDEGEGEHISIASLAPDLFCVTYSGLSKSHMIAGYRIGWMILSGNKSIAKDYIEGLDMLTNMRICSNVPAQSIVQTALGGHQSVNDYLVPGGRIYEQREYIYNALNSIDGITAVKPKAAFYIFPKIDAKKFNIRNDEQFALDLLHDEKLLIVQGTGFNWKDPDHFRVVYLPRVEVLKGAVDKMTHFFSHYRQ